MAQLYYLNDLPENKPAEIYAFLWAQRGDYYFDLGMYDSAKADFHRAVVFLPEAGQDSTLRGSTFLKLGVFFNRRGDMDSALFYYNKAHEFFDEEKHKDYKARLYNNESNAYMRLGYVETSLERLMKAHDYFVELGDERTTALTLMNLGDRYYTFDEFEKALEYERRAIAIFAKLGDSARLAEVYTNISNTFTELEIYDSVRYYITRAIRIKSSIGKKSDLLVSLHGLAKLELKTGNLDSAVILADSVYRTSREMGVLQGVYYGLLTKGEVYNAAGKYDSALAVLRTLSDFLNSTRAPVPREHVYFAYHDVFKGLKQYDSSLFYFSKFQVLQDSISASKRKSRVEELKVMFETEQKELENQKLRNEALIKALEDEKQSALLIALAIGIVVLSAFAGVLYRFNTVKARVNKKLKTLNNVQKKQNEKLKQLNRVKNMLFSIIGHDLRGPVGSLVTILNMINSGNLTEAEQKELLLELEGQATVSQSLIENVMHWAKTQMDGVKINPVTTHAYNCLTESLNLYKSQAKQKSITIKNEVDQDETVYVDPNMLNIAFRNLISNALKFTPEKGFIKISATKKDDLIVFCIKDSGRGISKEMQQSLFEKNFSTSGTQNEKGIGLGLYLTKDAIELSNGKIWVESEEGKGAAFCFSLPARNNK